MYIAHIHSVFTWNTRCICIKYTLYIDGIHYTNNTELFNSSANEHI